MKWLPWAIVAVLAYVLYRQNQPQIAQAQSYANLDVQLHQTAFSIANLVSAFKGAIASPAATSP